MSGLLHRIQIEISAARAKQDDWLLVSFTYGPNGRVFYGADSLFYGFAEHRELRGPRWRNLANAAGFADIGYRWIVAGPITMAILAKHQVAGGGPLGVVMHCDAVARWAPQCAKDSPVINSVTGFVGEASPRYRSLGARRPGRSSRKRLTRECSFCHSTYRLTLHHLLRREMGGATEPENLLCVCRDCHDRLHRKEIDDSALVLEVGLRRIENLLGSIGKRPLDQSG
jgi:hypothetical protein